MNVTNSDSKDLFDGSDTDVETCLNRILASSGFVHAERMQAFLTYVVRESQAGRGKDIRGKTIAQDVYGRTVATDGDPDNVVRVDARRLRRCLAEYYESEGCDDPLRIHIDSGGYAPRIELVGDISDVEKPAVAQTTLRNSDPLAKFLLIVLAALVAVAGLTTALILMQSGHEKERHGTDNLERQKTLERQALLEKSQTTLQAVNLAEQGFGMMFPLFDVERQKLAVGIFKQVIRLDSGFSEGYAGAAQSLASLAILVPLGSAEYLKEAKAMSDKALELSPAHARSQSSAAWVAFAEKDYARAVELSTRATELAPRDSYVLDNHGLITLFTGDFEAAAKITDPALRKGLDARRSGYRNIHAAANFHLGFYQRTLDLFDEIGPTGGPVSPPTLAYRTAAHHAIEEMQEARATARELVDTWSNVRIDTILSAFFRDSVHVRAVVDRLIEAGWQRGE